jgi:hypothetical protein
MGVDSRGLADRQDGNLLLRAAARITTLFES